MAHPATPAAISRVRPDDERTSVTCVNDVRHTPARALSGANVRHPNRTAAMIDRHVHHAEVAALKGASYRLKDRDLGRVPAARGVDDQA